MKNPKIDSFERTLVAIRDRSAKTGNRNESRASIQRFEFTVELAWKAIQSVLRAGGEDCNSPRSCMRSAFQKAWLGNDTQQIEPRGIEKSVSEHPGNDQLWLAMLEDRNRTSHTYVEVFARAVYHRLHNYPGLLRELLANLTSAAQR